MKTAAELYPDYAKQETEDGLFYGPGDYSPIVEAIGPVVLRVDDGDYQGDTRVLYRVGETWGVLIFGWGSCSGCDGLQACETLKDIDEMIRGIVEGVKWGSRDETLAYIHSAEERNEYSWHEEETQKFYAQAITLLEAP